MNLSFYVSHHLCDLDWISVIAFDRRSQAALIDAHSASKFSDCYSFALVNSVHVLAGVRALFRCSGPSAITRSVWAVVADSIKRSSIRTRTHVRKELREVVSPLRSHVDTSRSVQWILGTLRVVAPALGVLPRTILRCLSLSVSVTSISSYRCFDFFTATALSAATCKTPGINGGLFATVTLTIPSSTADKAFSDVGLSPRYNDQLTEAMPGSVYQLGHTSIFSQGVAA